MERNRSVTSGKKSIGPKLQTEQKRHCKANSMVSEMFSLPSLSATSEEDSESTMKSEEIQRVLQKSKIINSQVKLRLMNLLEKSKLANSIFPDCTKASTVKSAKASIVIDQEHLSQIKAHQEYLVELFEQLSLLQNEVEANQTKMFEKEDLEMWTPQRKNKLECCLEELDFPAPSCICNII